MQNVVRKPILEILACEAAIKHLDKIENESNYSDSVDAPLPSKKVRFQGKCTLETYDTRVSVP